VTSAAKARGRRRSQTEVEVEDGMLNLDSQILSGTRLVLCCASAANHRRSSASDADAGRRHSFFCGGDDPCPLPLPAHGPICQRPSDNALDLGSFGSRLFLHGRNSVHFTQALPWLNLSIYSILGVRVPSVTHLRLHSDKMLTLWADLHRGHPLSQALSIPSHAAALALGVLCAQTTGAA
jgi:hypothetical protein